MRIPTFFLPFILVIPAFASPIHVTRAVEPIKDILARALELTATEELAIRDPPSPVSPPLPHNIQDSQPAQPDHKPSLHDPHQPTPPPDPSPHNPHQPTPPPDPSPHMPHQLTPQTQPNANVQSKNPSTSSPVNREPSYYPPAGEFDSTGRSHLDYKNRGLSNIDPQSHHQAPSSFVNGPYNHRRHNWRTSNMISGNRPYSQYPASRYHPYYPQSRPSAASSPNHAPSFPVNGPYNQRTWHNRETSNMISGNHPFGRFGDSESSLYRPHGPSTLPSSYPGLSPSQYDHYPHGLSTPPSNPPSGHSDHSTLPSYPGQPPSQNEYSPHNFPTQPVPLSYSPPGWPARSSRRYRTSKYP